jgi:TetR/AcrR family transcriptional repressor of mexJK operon
METRLEQSIHPIHPNETSPKRLLVLRAAESLFLSQGYGAVSMDAVARAAGVSKATLYAHFPSKDVLFATIVADKGEDNPFGPDLFPTDVADLRAALEAIGFRVMEFMLRERTLAIYRIALAESARFPELGRAFYDNGPRRFGEQFSNWLTTLISQGQVRPANTEIATHQFMAMMRSGVFLRRSLAVPPEASSEEIHATVTAATDTWLRAYGCT